MTIAEAISRVDAIRPNGFRQAQKIIWLENLEAQIYREIVLPNENPENIHFEGFPPDVEIGTKLIAPLPYDDVYIKWLESQIHLANSEIDRYNNAKTLFNNAYAVFRDWWKREHMPLGRSTHFKF